MQVTRKYTVILSLIMQQVLMQVTRKYAVILSLIMQQVLMQVTRKYTVILTLNKQRSQVMQKLRQNFQSETGFL